MPCIDDFQATKQKLRARLRQRRAEAAAANGAAIAEVAAERFLAGVTLRPGLTVAGYWPLADELDPRPLLARLVREWQAILALPVSGACGQPLVFRAWDGLAASLAPGRYGIPEPLATAAVLQPDLVIVPLVGFDARGGRIGMGAGYYDATLAALRQQAASMLAVGYAFAVQQVPAVPRRAEDQDLDWVVTERGAISCRQQPAMAGKAG